MRTRHGAGGRSEGRARWSVLARLRVALSRGGGRAGACRACRRRLRCLLRTPHDDVSSGGTWLVVWPRYTRVPLQHDFQAELMQALNAYGRVPSFAEDGRLLG